MEENEKERDPTSPRTMERLKGHASTGGTNDSTTVTLASRAKGVAAATGRKMEGAPAARSAAAAGREKRGEQTKPNHNETRNQKGQQPHKTPTTSTTTVWNAPSKTRRKDPNGAPL